MQKESVSLSPIISEVSCPAVRIAAHAFVLLMIFISKSCMVGFFPVMVHDLLRARKVPESPDEIEEGSLPRVSQSQLKNIHLMSLCGPNPN